jgi:iron complex transport system substrate-binding protein
VAADPKGLTAAVALAVAAAVSCGPRAAGDGAPGGGKASRAPAPAARIVSLVPAVTEMLFAIGAGAQLVGVSSFDDFPPEAARVPRVGALLDPDTERILSLEPDLVILYGSQAEQQTMFERAGIRTFSYRHGGLRAALDTIVSVGDATGHADQARRVTREIERRLDAVRRRVAGRARPRTLLVFGRQPGSLRELYASGGVGFLHEMLDAAGGANVFAEVAQESVQPSLETLLARAPDVILEVHADGLLDRHRPGEAAEAWASLPSLPAVRRGRVHALAGDYLVVAGPRLAQATEALARVLHPDLADR